MAAPNYFAERTEYLALVKRLEALERQIEAIMLKLAEKQKVVKEKKSWES